MLLLFSFQNDEAFGQSLPLWEAGAGVLPLRADNYRGSPQNSWYYFPLPAYVYRGKNVEAESGYVRGHIFKSKDLVLDMSFNLGLNVDSDQNELREGMRDLDPTFEVGPILRYYLWKSKDSQHFINLEMPYRAVYPTNLTYVDHVGYYSIPYINFLSKGGPLTLGWTTEISYGPQYGSSGFHNRFYAVDTKDVKPGRERFHSVSGYSGMQFSIVLSRRIKNVLIIPFFRYDYLDGAVYNQSPLYKNPHYTMFGMSIQWFFAKSEKLQEAPTMVK